MMNYPADEYKGCHNEFLKILRRPNPRAGEPGLLTSSLAKGAKPYKGLPSHTRSWMMEVRIPQSVFFFSTHSFSCPGYKIELLLLLKRNILHWVKHRVFDLIQPHIHRQPLFNIKFKKISSRFRLALMPLLC